MESLSADERQKLTDQVRGFIEQLMQNEKTLKEELEGERNVRIATSFIMRLIDCNENTAYKILQRMSTQSNRKKAVIAGHIINAYDVIDEMFETRQKVAKKPGTLGEQVRGYFDPSGETNSSVKE